MTSPLERGDLGERAEHHWSEDTISLRELRETVKYLEDTVANEDERVSMGVLYLDVGPWSEEEIAQVRKRMIERGWARDADQSPKERT